MSPEQILKRYIRKCCKKSWDARNMRVMTSGSHGWKRKYKDFNGWWRKCGLKHDES